MPKPTRKPRCGKVGKPRPDFPLAVHPRGYWCKNVRGRSYYFGKVAAAWSKRSTVTPRLKRMAAIPFRGPIQRDCIVSMKGYDGCL